MKLMLMWCVGLQFVSFPAFAFTITGFSQPYGVAIDPSTSQVYVSNINGLPDAKDSNGFISRLSGAGEDTKLRFIEGGAGGVLLHAPKGMEVVGTTLYVADIDALQSFELPSGKYLTTKRFAELEAGHLYDVASGPDQMLYITDALKNAVYRFNPKSGEATVFIADQRLSEPHAIVWSGPAERFFVGGWSSGKVFAYDRSGKSVPQPGIFLSTIEGMAADDQNRLYVGSASLRALYQVGKNTAVSAYQVGLSFPAGMAYSVPDKRLIVALHDDGSVRAFSVGGW